MIIIPAIDIMNHQVVQLVGGVPGTEKIQLPDPVETAMSWIDKGAKYLHIVDLDAAFGEDDNLSVIKKIIARSDVPVEVGGGIRKESTIKRLLDLGVDRVIVGTRAVTDLEWFNEMALTFPDKLVMALDTKGGHITTHGWKEVHPYSLKRMMGLVRDLPLAGVLNTNVDVEGQANGIDEDWVSEFTSVCNTHPVIASGGVTTVDDARKLASHGVQGAVVGVSIYTGLLKPWEWEKPWEV